jgi:hypothetical protein
VYEKCKVQRFFNKNYHIGQQSSVRSPFIAIDSYRSGAFTVSEKSLHTFSNYFSDDHVKKFLMNNLLKLKFCYV